MPVSDESWSLAATGPQVRLVKVPAALLEALAADRDTSRLPGGALVSAYLAGAELAGLWRRRSAQVGRNPGDGPWVTRLIVVDGVATAVGAAGFHGAPDAGGVVEVGYRVDPCFRRRGYARRALETLLAVASAEPIVRTVRASIAPDNAPSRALVEAYGFVPVGEQWDDEDGLEIIFEVRA
jgi:[ribosomal protein S5]-alanine N-acetyltransferase